MVAFNFKMFMVDGEERVGDEDEEKKRKKEEKRCKKKRIVKVLFDGESASLLSSNSTWTQCNFAGRSGESLTRAESSTRLDPADFVFSFSFFLFSEKEAPDGKGESKGNDSRLTHSHSPTYSPISKPPVPDKTLEILSMGGSQRHSLTKVCRFFRLVEQIQIVGGRFVGLFSME